jgi:hypothetical protein
MPQCKVTRNDGPKSSLRTDRFRGLNVDNAWRESVLMRNEFEDHKLLRSFARRLAGDRSAGAIAGTIAVCHEGEIGASVRITLSHCGPVHLLAAAHCLIEAAMPLLRLHKQSSRKPKRRAFCSALRWRPQGMKERDSRPPLVIQRGPSPVTSRQDGEDQRAATEVQRRCAKKHTPP